MQPFHKEKEEALHLQRIGPLRSPSFPSIFAMQKSTHRPQGYRKLAKLMGPYPEIAIFRRFGSLTMFNLMRLQTELVAIDDQLQRIGEQDDMSADSNISSYSTDFYALNTAKPPDDAQLLLLEQSRLKLEQYCKVPSIIYIRGI